MKKLLTLLPLGLLAFWSCEVKSFVPQSETLVAVAPPPLRSETSYRLRDGRVEVQTSGTWKPVAGAGLPKRVVYPEMTPSWRPLEGLALGAGGLVGVFTPFEVYFSTDAGQTFSKKVDRSEYGSAGYITALALHPTNPEIWAVGTSFHGLFLTTDGGKKWKDLNAAIKTLSPGPGWQEQINSLAFSVLEPQTLYAGVGVRGNLYSFDTAKATAKNLGGPEKDQLTLYNRLFAYTEGEKEYLEVGSRDRWWKLDPKTMSASDLGARQTAPAWDEAKKARMARAQDKYGLYLTSYQAANPKQLDGHLAMMEKRGLNALVVDFKDDTGDVAYDSQVELAKKAGAVKKRLDVPALVKKVHDKGFYLIARVVVFKDMRLFQYAGNKYALWDYTTKRPWGFFHKNIDDQTKKETWIQKEFWVDQYAQDVWNYNAAIAHELEGLGIDEVQFDYIRFPSDGPTQNITHRFKLEHQNRMDALVSFLRTAREKVQIPLSADIYGFNGWYVMDYLGQNMAVMADYLDAISPMLYPSHYDVKFLPAYSYIDRAQVIYQESGDRGYLATRGQVLIRSWIQAFLLGAETKFSDPAWMSYFDKQLMGHKKSKGNGFLLWNASNNYYMVTKSLSPYTGLGTQEKK